MRKRVYGKNEEDIVRCESKKRGTKWGNRKVEKGAILS